MTASEAVVDAAADAAGTSALELDPLARTIHPDAFDTYVDRLSLGPEGTRGTVEFVYDGYDVTVSGDGTVTAAERELSEGTATARPDRSRLSERPS